MKKELLFALLVLAFNQLFAHTVNFYVQKVDSITAPLNKSLVTTDILYDRVLPLAALDLFNSKTDTAEYLFV